MDPPVPAATAELPVHPTVYKVTPITASVRRVQEIPSGEVKIPLVWVANLGLYSRSFSTSSPSCSFRFFETSDNYFFVSDEFLIKEANSKNKIKEFIYGEAIQVKTFNLILSVLAVILRKR